MAQSNETVQVSDAEQSQTDNPTQILQNSDDNDFSKVSSRLHEFVEYFVKEFEAKLHAYLMFFEGETKKSGKLPRKIGQGIGGILGGAVGLLLGSLGSGAEFGSKVGKEAGEKVGSRLEATQNTRKITSSLDLLSRLENDKASFRKALVETGVDVFQSLEMQFMRVTTSLGPKKAMQLLARDAVNRAISYMGNKDRPISEGVLLGTSKIESFFGFPIPTSRLKTPGSKVQYEYEQNKLDWSTASLYDKVGLVIPAREKTSSCKSYYTKKNETSRTSKYGYRRLLTQEIWDDLKDEYICDNTAQSHSGQFRNYVYILNPQNIEEQTQYMVPLLNGKDDNLEEERIKEVLTEVRNDISEGINVLKQQSQQEHLEMLSFVESNFEKLWGNKFFEKFDEYLKEAREQGILLREFQNTIADGHNSKKEPRKSIWYDVRESMKVFTALSPGRIDMLNEIATKIEQQIVVIAGLSGLGKSELAINYARSHYTEEDSVIWINAKTQQTTKESFQRLYTRIGFKIRDDHGEEKGIQEIIDNTHDYFRNNSGRKLYIFDNAHKYDEIEGILPIHLPPGAKKPHILITSLSTSGWRSPRVEILTLQLIDFTDSEGINFVNSALKIDNVSQDQDVAKLVKRLHNFPLALQQATAYIIQQAKFFKNVDPKKELTVSNYLMEYEKKVDDVLKSKLFQEIGSDYANTTFTAIQITLDKVKNHDVYGEKAIEIVNTMAYFSPDNITTQIFLESSGFNNQKELGAAIELLKQYSIVKQQGGWLNIHGLVQQVRRLVLREQQIDGAFSEEKSLKEALRLLKKSVVNRESIACNLPHITSVWKHAIKYDKLIQTFIIDDVMNNSDYTSYFHLIAEGGNYEIIRTIVTEIKQNHPGQLTTVINAMNTDRGMPLHNAVLSGDEQIVNLLIQNGANVNAKKINDWTPLHLASRNGHLQIATILVHKVKDIDAKTKFKFTPLHLAAQNGHVLIVNVLLQKGGDANLTTTKKYTALHFAAKKGSVETVDALLKHGANVNTQDNDSFTPLHWAALNADINVLSKLLESSGIDINMKTSKGNTAIHLAAEKGHLEIVTVLIAKHACVDIRNEEGKTASEVARENLHLEAQSCITEYQEKVYMSNVGKDTPFKYNRRQGTSGMGGQLYEIELSMYFLLQGIIRKADDEIEGFHLATNMKEAGDFDDVVFKYKYKENGVERSKIIFLQAKHKEHPENPKEKITIERLFSKSEKKLDFSLKDYFTGYRKIKAEFRKPHHPIFKGKFEDSDCDFIIFTNVDFKDSEKKTEANIANSSVDSKSILRLEESYHYYKVVFGGNNDDRIFDALMYSSDCKKLAKELADCIFSVDGLNVDKGMLNTYHASLANEVIAKEKGKLRDSFLSEKYNSQFKTAFLEELLKEDFDLKSTEELISDISSRKIKLPPKFGNIKGKDLRLPLPRDMVNEPEINEFLSNLKLFVVQPNESELREIIKRLMQSTYSIEESEIHAVFSDVKNKVERWWIDGKYLLTETNTFFQESARVSILFDVKKPVHLFTGRIEELEDLNKKIHRNPEKVTVISQMTSVSGLGGIGKTELAREYIQLYAENYDHNIMWINAATEATIIESFRRLAQDKLRISTKNIDGKEKSTKSIVEEVYRFFNKRKCLFLFDNAERDQYFYQFLPLHALNAVDNTNTNRPYILITSRNQEWERGIEVLRLNELKLEEGIAFVKKGLGIPKDDETQNQLITDLVLKLQLFPLAIQQAISYIDGQRMADQYGINEYLQEFDQKTKDLLNSEVFTGIDDHYTRTTFTTWQITNQKIASDQQYGELAINILEALAYFAPENVPREIFLNLAANNESQLKFAVRLLVKYSMANGKERQSILNIHRLVQQVTRLQLSGQGKEIDSIRKVLTLIQSNLYTENLDHAVAAWNHASEYNELVQEFSKFSLDIVYNLNDAVRYEEANLFGTNTLKIMIKVLGENHPDVLSLQSNIAWVLDNQGKYDQALEIYEDIYAKLKIREVSQPENPEILKARDNIALVLHNQGRYKESLEVYEEIYEKSKIILGQNNPVTLKMGNNMALVLDKLSMFNKALVIYQEVYAQRKITLGEQSPLTLLTRNNIAVVLGKLGKQEEELELFEEIYNVQKNSMGAKHPDTLLTMHNMAITLGEQGEYDRALSTFNELYAVRKEMIGENHPNTLSTRHSVAVILHKQEKFEEALKTYQAVYDAQKTVLGDTNAYTLLTRNNMVEIFVIQGRYEEALHIFHDVYEKRKNNLGESHIDTLTTRNDMAKVLQKQGKNNQALRIFQEVYDQRKIVLGLNHPDTVATKICLKELKCKLL